MTRYYKGTDLDNKEKGDRWKMEESRCRPPYVLSLSGGVTRSSLFCQQ